MNRTRSQDLGSHDPQQHIRYCEVYTIDAPVTISGATNASPIVITAASHGFQTGDVVHISDVEGNTAANGTWTVTVTGTDTFSLNGSTGSGAYSAGGEAIFAQPVQVKALRWNSASFAYVTYGDPFRIGGIQTAEEVETEQKLWITWRRDARRWESLGNGIGDHFQIVRGLATAAVSPSDPAFQIESIAEYEQYSKTPSSPLWVKAPDGGVTLSEGDAVWAIYRENVLTFDPGGGSVQVDWLMFEPGSSNTPPLRAFELTANKTLASATATAKFLDIDGNLVGSNVTLADPEQRFSGRIANSLYTGSPAFRGLALLRTDLAAEDPDQWEIIAMEGLAEFIVVKFYSTLTDWKYVSNLSAKDDWHKIAPQDEDADVTISDPASILPASAASVPTDHLLIARCLDPDTSPPTYAAVAMNSLEELVRVAVVGSQTIDGATWDGTDITDDSVTVYPCSGTAPDDTGSYSVTVDLGLDDPVTIATGKFRLGHVQGSRLVRLQCPEWTLPAGWGE